MPKVLEVSILSGIGTFLNYFRSADCRLRVVTTIPSMLTATKMVPDQYVSTLARGTVVYARCGCRYVIPGSATVATQAVSLRGTQIIGVDGKPVQFKG